MELKSPMSQAPNKTNGIIKLYMKRKGYDYAFLE